MQMNDDEEISKFFSRLMMLTNQLKKCGEKITELHKVEKILRSLTVKFDHIVMDIEKSKGISEMKLK